MFWVLNRRAFIETAEVVLANAAYFCVPCCLAMMDEETGLRVLERLRAYLSESPVSLAKGPVEIHASFGLAVIDREKSAEKGYVQKLIHEADTALYAAKLAGRNRVVLFSQEMESSRISVA